MIDGLCVRECNKVTRLLGTAHDCCVVVSAEHDYVRPIDIGGVNLDIPSSHRFGQRHILALFRNLKLYAVKSAVLNSVILKFFRKLVPTEVGARAVFDMAPN
jgi:hypothetical protein